MTKADWEEVEANRFAMALLMPEFLLRQDINHLGGRALDEQAIKELAKLYEVTTVAMHYRLIGIGVLSPPI